MPTNFASMRAKSEQAANPGGFLKIARLPAFLFTAEWPAAADVTAGEVTGLPSEKLPADQEWSVIDMPKDTASFTYNNVGEKHGYTNWSHGVSIEMANLDKTIAAELMKDVNVGSVFVGKARDGKWYVVGNSENPLQLMHQGTSGARGSDKRGTVATAEEEGYMFPMLPLAAAVVADITLADFPA